MPRFPTRFEIAAARARQEWGRATPFRVGLVVGWGWTETLTERDLAGRNRRWLANYRQGVDHAEANQHLNRSTTNDGAEHSD